MVRMDWFISNLLGGIKLKVRQEDAAAAEEVLSQPIPEDFEVDGVGEFEQPRCPNCQSLDVTFEALNKPIAFTSAWVGLPLPIARNSWKCESCGSKWQDTDETER
jgi:transposase-like protein